MTAQEFGRKPLLFGFVVHHHRLGEVGFDEGDKFFVFGVVEITGLQRCLALEAGRKDVGQFGIQFFRADIEAPLEALYSRDTFGEALKAVAISSIFAGGVPSLNPKITI
jgi:hypothetical protein